MKPLKRRIK